MAEITATNNDAWAGLQNLAKTIGTVLENTYGVYQSARNRANAANLNAASNAATPTPTTSADTGLTYKQLLVGGGAVVAAIVLAVVLIRRR